MSEEMKLQVNEGKTSRWSKDEKKQLTVFMLVAFGLPVLMGILMGFSYYRGNDVSAFANSQMFYPAMGVMLACFLTRKKDQAIPGKFYIGFIILTAVMTIMTILTVIMPQGGWFIYLQYAIMAGSVILIVLWLLEKKEVKASYGLSITGIKKSRPWFYVLLFLVLYVGRILLNAIIMKEFKETAAVMFNMGALVTVLIISVNFFLVFAAFFGEEYGWRYFLQPLLQKRFGLRGGIILLGILWGLWHLPINVFYYSPETWLQSVVNQQIVCISYAIFFGYAYMKTKNIWVATIIHFFNNNLVVLFTGTGDIGGYVLTWKDVLIALLFAFITYGIFIFFPAYKKGAQIKTEEASQDIP